MGSDVVEEWSEVSLHVETTMDRQLEKSCCLDSARTGLFNQTRDYQDSEITVLEQMSRPTEVAPKLDDCNKDAFNQSVLRKGSCPEPICSTSFDNAITTTNQLGDIVASENEDLANFYSSIDQKVLLVGRNDEPEDVYGNTGFVCVSDQVMKEGCGVDVGLSSNGSDEGNLSSSLECPAETYLDAEQALFHGKTGDSTEKGEIPLPSSLFSTLPSTCAHLGDENIVDPSQETDSGIVGFVEEKQDISPGSGLMTQALQLEGNACNLVGETLSVASECAIEVPTSLVDGSSVHLLPADRNIDDCSGAPSCSGLIDSTVQPDSEEKGNDKPEFVPIYTCSENLCLLTQKSTRRCKSNQMSETRKTTKQSKRKNNKKLFPGQNIGISLKFAKRKRSLQSKQARSSVWGTMGNIMQVFTENDSLPKHGTQLIQIEKHSSQRKRRGIQGNKRKPKTLDGGSTVVSSQKTCSSTSHIRLRVKVGGQRSLEVLLPEGMGSQVSRRSTVNKYENETESKVSSKFTNPIIHKLGENAHATSQETCMGGDLERPVGTCHLDSDHGDKSLESAVTLDASVGNSLDNFHGVASHTGVAVLDEAVDNQYSYPGTSPDSEVVNSIQDTGIGVQVQQDLHGSVLNSSKVVIGPMNGADLTVEPRKTKKGKKNGKVKGHPLKGCFPVEKKSTGRGSRNKSRKSSKKGGSGEEVGCVHTPSDAFIVERIGNASSKSSGIEIYSPDSLPGSEIVKLGEMLKVVETATESSELSMQDVPAKASKPSTADCFCDSGKLVGSKLPKCSKPKVEMSKRKSRISDSSRRRRGNACKQKKKDVQKSVNKSNVKENGILDQQYGGDNHLERSSGTLRHPESERSAESSGMNALGCNVFNDLGKPNAGSKFASNDILKSSVINSELDDQPLPPQRAWVRCDECHKWRCISVALANSIEETNCRWTCKDNIDKAFTDCSIPQEKTNAEINAELEISDASGEEDASDTHTKSEGFKHKQLTVPRKAPWKPIKSNMFLHRNRKNQTIDEIMVCHCKLPPPDGSFGCGEECLNRMLNIECVRGTCPCGDHCSNQQFQKRKYAKLKSFPCGRKGYGLQLLEDVSRGAFLIEYVGEVLDLNAYEARQREYAAKGQKHFYFMTLNGSEVIDACAKGNLGRFINHSCEPNCRTEKWMVNGEVCIGLFAIRDIKKGEEVTFDYNYVRVFGAAAKRCVCGSAECRGYIGGDPSSTEVVVQGDSDDEYPEPVMVEEDGDNEYNLDKITSDGVPVHHAEIVLKSNDVIIKSPSSIERSGIYSKEESAVGKSPSALGLAKDSPVKEESIRRPPSFLPLEVHQTSALEPVEITFREENTVDETLPASQSQETSLPITNAESKLSSDAVTVNSKFICSTEEQKPSISKARPVPKSSRSSLSIKKGKSDSHPLTSSKHQVLTNKPKKMLEGAANSRLDGVDEKLVDLLDSDGGLSKRKDATKGYLKLLVLTAASGDNLNGEAVQSIRDLSIILDALLKTKSRMVLVDIINKNGLQMLHNIMKQNRRNFNRTPIIRKLLKVLEYLAQRGILTPEHIYSGPPCAGMESFKESIIALTRHNDVQVHQIARNFRDRWMPRNLKRSTYPDRDDLKRLELQSGSNCSHPSMSYKFRHDQGSRPTEAIDCISQGSIAATPLDTNLQEATAGCSTNGIKGRKRKSRWDQPSEINQNQDLPELHDHRVKQKLESSFQQPEVSNIAQQPVTEVDNISNCCLSQQAEASSDVAAMQWNHEDAPPGFSPPFNSVPSDAFSATAVNHTGGNNHHFSCACDVVSGYLQERYLAHLPVSYGIPMTFVKRVGTTAPSAENSDSWAVAPSIPFHPFPPLPPFPRDRSSSVVSPSASTMNGPKEVKLDGNHSSTTVSEDVISSDVSGPRSPDKASTGDNRQHPVDQMRCTYGNLGRRYFRQQKWNNWKNGPPWHWKRNSWGGSRGSNSRNGVQHSVSLGNVEHKVGSFSCSEGASDGREHINSTLYQHHPQRQYNHH